LDGAFSVGDSHEWEEKCKQLLAIHYGDDLQLIDASRSGDLGLEAFTQQSCRGFQCYAPLEPLSTQERYEKHRDKLTQDLGKLEKNQDALVIILGTTRLKRYVFMVPRFDPPLRLRPLGRLARDRRQVVANPRDHVSIFVHNTYKLPSRRRQLGDTCFNVLPFSLAWSWYDKLICTSRNEDGSCCSKCRHLDFPTSHDAKRDFVFENERELRCHRRTIARSSLRLQLPKLEEEPAVSGAGTGLRFLNVATS
jgi:hypothetical protein